MSTRTQKHTLSGDTVFLAASLKRLERKARPTLLTEWLCQQLRGELEARARMALRAVGA